jgi:CTP:molybdopterin cytidylyltransferase MocA
MTRIGGLVLAAGEGRRFGGPKQLAPVAGRPLLEHALAALAAVPALDPLVLVLGARAEEVRAGVDTAPFTVVVAHDWAEGSAASLRAGVAALGDVDAALVALGDQPFLPARIVEAILARAGPGADVVRATYDGAPGHPVLLGRKALDRVPDARGDTGARGLLGGLRVRTWECGAEFDPTDIDTREQLERITR